MNLKQHCGGTLPDTIPAMLRARAQLTPDEPALFARDANGGWTGRTWREYTAEVEALASALMQHGVTRGDRVAVILPTIPEWEIAGNACLLAGAVVVGIETHASAAHLHQILGQCQARVLFVEDAEMLRRVPEEDRDSFEIVVHLAQGSDPELRAALSWKELLRSSRDQVLEPLAGPAAADDATIIFTSGTTGAPKGIAYTHAQCTLACGALLDVYGDMGSDDTVICWLPLANLFQRMINLCAVGTGSPVYFVSDPRKVMDFVPEVRPSLFVGVPRFYEKLREGMLSRIGDRPWWQRMPARAALGLAIRNTQRRLTGRRAMFAALERLLDRVVLSQLRQAMGGRIKYMITGSAACPRSVLEFFHALGMPLLEAYGMSEDIVPIAANAPARHRVGSVGMPLPQNELRFGEDGELFVRGPGVFRGYLGREDAPFGADDFYPTSDYAELDEDGFLHLKGRKSEVIKTSTGRRISLPRIEGVLREIPSLDQVVVIGSGRKSLIALSTLSVSRPMSESHRDSRTGHHETHLCEEFALSIAEALGSKSLLLQPYERVAACLLVTEGFRLETGELTPNLKLRRTVIETRYAEEIDAMYRRLETSGPPPEKGSANLPYVKCI